MATKIAIIGAGQSGLLLGIGLVKNNIETTIFSDRTPEQILTGRIMSSQVLFDNALNIERELGLNFWDGYCPNNTAICLQVAGPGNPMPVIQWRGDVDQPFQAVDQRIKFSTWINEFKRLGGNFVLRNINEADLDSISHNYDLVIICTGKSELKKIFDVDQSKTIFNKPARSLAQFYVHGMEPSRYSELSVNIIPNVGEYFTPPALTTSGYCNMMLFEGLPGGELDCWDDFPNSSAKLEYARKFLEKYIPWEARRCQNIALTDDHAALIGKYTPQVRKPIHKLASGKYILGMGDVVVLNDPIAGQGANNATKCAKIYLSRILENLQGQFDSQWMQNTFDLYWEHAQWATKWSNLLLLPLPGYLVHLLSAAEKNKELANFLSNGFNDPASLFPWVESETAANQLIEKCMSEKPFSKIKSLKQDNILTENYFDVLKNKNDAFVVQLKKSKLMKIVSQRDIITDRFSRAALLNCIQVISDYFQKMVLLRHSLTDNYKFLQFTQQHLDEEINHNVLLLKERKNLPPAWDAALEATMAWFCWKTLSLDRIEKAVLMHLILETSEKVFFEQTNILINQNHAHTYFETHNQHASDHAEMAWDLLSNLRDEEYLNLFKIQQQGWEMMLTAFNRVAELCLSQYHSKTSEAIT